MEIWGASIQIGLRKDRMKLIKLIYTPVDQQGNWLIHLNNDILDGAMQVEIYLKDSYDGGQEKTIVIYALLSEQGNDQ